MQIKLDTSALGDSKWYEYAIRFFFGGAVSVVAGLLAKKYGPAIGGLFLAFPAIFPATATLAEKHEREKKERIGLHGEKRGRDAAALEALGAALGSLGLLAFAAAVWLPLPRHSAWLVLVGAAVLWFATSCCLWLLRKYRHKVFGVRSHTNRARRPLYP